MQKISDIRFDYSVDELIKASIGTTREQFLKIYYDAVESRLANLIADGVAVHRIGLQNTPGGETVIVVDGIPNSTFLIDYQGLGPTSER